MTEKELISKIKKLREIKPNQDWVVLSKERILKSEETANEFKVDAFEEKKTSSLFSFLPRVGFFRHKLAFASIISLFVLIGLFGVSENSLPGDPLFSLRKIAEKGELAVISEKQDYNMEIVKKRLDDLLKVAERNEVKKLAPAIKEYQSNVSKVAKDITREKDKTKLKKMVLRMTELEDQESKVKSYGVEVGDNKELKKAYAQKLVEVLEPLIEDLRKKNLNEDQVEELRQAEEYLAENNYEKALLKILDINNQ